MRPVKRTHYGCRAKVSIPLRIARRKTDLVTVEVPHAETGCDTKDGERDGLRLREVGRIDQRPEGDALATREQPVLRWTYHDFVTNTNEYRYVKER